MIQKHFFVTFSISDLKHTVLCRQVRQHIMGLGSTHTHTHTSTFIPLSTHICDEQTYFRFWLKDTVIKPTPKAHTKQRGQQPTHAHWHTHNYTRLHTETHTNILFLIQGNLWSHIALSTYLQPLIVLPVFLFYKTRDTHSLFAAYLVNNPLSLL